MTVTEVTHEERTVVTQIDIETPAASRIELTHDKGKKSNFAFSSGSPQPNGRYRLQLTVSAEQIKRKEGATHEVEFKIALEIGRTSTSTSETAPMPAGAKGLADVLSIPIKSGEYKYGVATKMLTFNGVTYTLVVSKPE